MIVVVPNAWVMVTGNASDGAEEPAAAAEESAEEESELELPELHAVKASAAAVVTARRRNGRLTGALSWRNEEN